MFTLRRHLMQGLAGLLLTLLALGTVQANTVSTAPDVADPPGRVGRLSELQGTVWLYHPADGDWTQAERNRPLTGGDRLSTDENGRAEVQIGSTTLRLDGRTEVEVLRLDDERVDLQLHDGSASVRLRSSEAVPEFALQTSEGRFTVQRTGRYRFDRDNGASFVTVDSGQSTYEGRGSALPVYAGQRAEFWVDAAGVAQYRLVEPQRDAFAAWVGERDRYEDRASTPRYVSPEMTGAEELDRYGQWRNDPEYGTLWQPRQVVAGWAPYTVGRWAWVAPWGWTWVDEAPWGFAPFHYGRWVYVGSSWCWSPGQYVRRPVYAPALVAWVAGRGITAGLSIGGPTIGWVPLAPREVYVPAYRVSPGYVRNVNITHVTNITNITTIVNNPQQAVDGRDFHNRKFPHGVTFVPTSTLTNRAPVAPAATGLRDTASLRQVDRKPSWQGVLAAPPANLVATPPVADGNGGPRRSTPWPRRDDRPRAPVAEPRPSDAPVTAVPTPAPPRPVLPPRATRPEADRDVVREPSREPVREPNRYGPRDQGHFVEREAPPREPVRDMPREVREPREPREAREPRELRDTPRPSMPAPQPVQPVRPPQPVAPPAIVQPQPPREPVRAPVVEPPRRQPEVRPSPEPRERRQNPRERQD